MLVLSKLGMGPGSASSTIEFELTRNQHTRDKSAHPTLTAMLKDPPPGLIPEAWRILQFASAGKQLLPDLVQNYKEKHLAYWAGRDRPVTDSSPMVLRAKRHKAKRAPVYDAVPPTSKSARTNAPSQAIFNGWTEHWSEEHGCAY